jgi:hypothetical protein
LDVRSLDAVAYLNNIADLIYQIQGDKYNPMHRNIEGEDQQDAVLNSAISNIMHELSNAKTKQEFLNNHPEFDDVYLNNSILMKGMFDADGKRTDFTPKISILEGINDISIQNGVKSSALDQKARLFQDFNANLQGFYNILIPADSESEWYINIPNDGYFKWNTNSLKDFNIDKLINYLKDEIDSALEYDTNPLKYSDAILSQVRPLRDGTERLVGKSLQIFKDILSDDIVTTIHQGIDEGKTSDDITTTLKDKLREEIRNHLKLQASKTFREMAIYGLVERTDRQHNEFDQTILAGKQYKFYGLNSNFTKGKDSFSKVDYKLSNNRTYTIDQMNSSTLQNLIEFRELNYFVNQVEMTKVFIGNPYFYTLIEKRAKSMLSQRENSYYAKLGDRYSFDQQLTVDKNMVTDGTNQVAIPNDHLHFHTFKSHIPTWIFKDHVTFNPDLGSEYHSNNSVDAQSFATPNAYRELLIKNGARFTKAQEDQFQLEQAFERYLMDKDGILPYKDEALRKIDQKIIQGKYKEDELTYRFKDGVFQILKPLGSGHLEEKGQNPFVLKTSTAQMNYRMVRGTPMQNVYLSMLKNRIGMLSYESAMKVGLKKDSTGKVPQILSYDQINTSPDVSAFNHKIPFKYIGIQVETGTQKDSSTIGTQTTKLILTDLFEYGVPEDYDVHDKTDKEWENRHERWHALPEEEKEKSEIYRLEKRHRQAIENLQTAGYYNLLSKLGINEGKDDNGRLKYNFANGYEKTYELLKDEMSKRGISPNIYDLMDDKTITQKPLEALQSYDQASFIIMSLVNKSLVRPKLHGGQKIQFSSALLNNLKTEGIELYYKSPEGMKKWEGEELSDTEKKTLVPSSPQLKFYRKEDGKTLSMEVMLPNHFKQKIDAWRERNGKSPMTDSEVINWLRTNQPKLLEGIGFRIPTQALSSIDSFIIKGFLPSYLGDSVAVPSELTTKVGSDFDVDKLNTYLNNWALNNDTGMPEYVRPFGSIEEATQHFQNEFQDLRQQKLSRLTDEKKREFRRKLQEALDTMSYGLEETKQIESFIDRHSEILDSMIDDSGSLEDAAADFFDILDGINKTVNTLNNEDVQQIKEKLYVKEHVKQSLENNYFQTVDDILKLPRNFYKLLSANNNKGVEEYAAEIQDRLDPDRNKALEKLTPEQRKKYINYSNITDSNYLRKKRWSFVVGKAGVGIAALAATGHVNAQKIGFQLNLKGNDNLWFKDGGFIGFDHNKLKGIPILSGITKADGNNVAEFVSKYINGYVDIAKGSWILDIGAQLEVAGIYLTMERLGIPTEQIVYFLNQPVIKNFIGVRAQKRSPISKLNPVYKGILDSINTDEKYYLYIKTKTHAEETKSHTFPLTTLKKAVDEWGKGQDLFQYLEGRSAEEKQQQFDVLTQFLQLKDYADYIRKSQSVSNYDTANINSMHLYDSKEETYEGMTGDTPSLVQDFGGRRMPDALREDTFVSNLLNKYDTLDRHFISDIFQLQQHSIRQRLREAMMNINPSVRFDEADQRTLMDKISKFTINALTLDQMNLAHELKDWMNARNLSNEIDKFKAMSAKSTIDGQDLAMIKSNRWIKNLKVQVLRDGPPSAVSQFGYLTIDNAPQYGDGEADMWRYDLNVLKESIPFKPLYELIMKSALIQFGAEYNRNSFANILDWKDFYENLQHGVEATENLGQYNIERMIAQSKAWDTSIISNAEYFTKNTAYKLQIGFDKDGKAILKNTIDTKSMLRGKTGMKRWVDVNPQTGSISDLILLRYSEETPANSAYYTKYGFKYFSLKQSLSSLDADTLKSMNESGNFDYNTFLLYEATPFIVENGGEKFIAYRPINTKGHRYINEYTNDVQPSQLSDMHDKVDPALADDDVIEDLLRSRFDKVKVIGSPANHNEVSDPDSATAGTPEQQPPSSYTSDSKNQITTMKRSDKKETFLLRKISGEQEEEEVKGYAVTTNEYPEFKGFVYKEGSKWKLAEQSSHTLLIDKSYKTIKELLSSMPAILNDMYKKGGSTSALHKAGLFKSPEGMPKVLEENQVKDSCAPAV